MMEKKLKPIYFFVVIVIRVDGDIENGFRNLREYVEQTIKRSGYQNIKLSKVFERMHPKNLVLNFAHMSE